MSTIDRRAFLKSAAAGTGGLALAGPLQAFAAAGAGAAPADGRGHGGRPRARDYGPLSPVVDNTTGEEILALPAGFQYWSLGDVGSPMADGLPTPPAHDGMAAFRWGRKIRLVRNHEVRGASPAFGGGGTAYDPDAGGGNTIVEFDPRNPSQPRTWGVLAGTSTNCAGGATPWQTWLTCEETVEVLGKPHGYVFEVPARAEGFQQATPIPSMGRFAHEAVAVEPGTNIVYLTEDAGATSGFYRHVPASTRAVRWPVAACRRSRSWAPPTPTSARGSRPAPASRSSGSTSRSPMPTSPTGRPCSVRPPPVAPRRSAGSRARGTRRPTGRSTSTRRTGAPPAPARCGRGTGSAGASTSSSSTNRRRPTCCSSRTTSRSARAVACCCARTLTGSASRSCGGSPATAGCTTSRPTSVPGTIPGSTTPRSWDEFAGATFLDDWLFVNIQTPGVTLAITGPWRDGPLG